MISRDIWIGSQTLNGNFSERPSVEESQIFGYSYAIWMNDINMGDLIRRPKLEFPVEIGFSIWNRFVTVAIESFQRKSINIQTLTDYLKMDIQFYHVGTWQEYSVVLLQIIWYCQYSHSYEIPIHICRKSFVIFI